MTAAEIKTAVAVIVMMQGLIFPYKNPRGARIQAYKREAFVVILEPNLNKTYEAVVDLKASKLNLWKKFRCSTTFT
jgi:Cu2+-containing amine oxidase